MTIAVDLGRKATKQTSMNGLQACLFKYITVAAFRIYAQRGDDGSKRGGWRLCIK